MRRLPWLCLCMTGSEKLCKSYHPRDSAIVCRPCVIIVLRGTLPRAIPNTCGLATVLCACSRNRFDWSSEKVSLKICKGIFHKIFTKAIKPKLTGIWKVKINNSVPNLHILSSIGWELCRRQTQTGANCDFYVQFYLEDEGQFSHKAIEMSANVFYISASNVMISAWPGGESSFWKARWHTDRHTERRRQQYPEAKTCPQ